MSIEPQAEAIEKQTGRLESFSDGVFAVAITLLVFNLQVPHLPTGAISVPALGSALFAQWPSYLTFITSFATILIMWGRSHKICQAFPRKTWRPTIARRHTMSLRSSLSGGC